MGDALVVLTVPEEVFMHGDKVQVTITRDDIWQLPPEPRDLNWHEDPVLREEQDAKVATSLADFLNTRLKRLHWMVRSGWWMLDEAWVQARVKGAD
jgi:hypothetical protein